MKKLLVLSALLGLLALPAFSADVSFGGDLSFGFITDFDAEAESTAATIDMKGSVDDYNSVDIRLIVGNLTGTQTVWTDFNDDGVVDPGETSAAFQKSLGLEKAAINTDVGAWLGLEGIGVKLQWGYDDPDFNWYGDISNFEKESMTATPGMTEYWGLDLVLSYGMFELELAGNPGAAGDAGDFLAGVAVKEPIPGLNAELYLYQAGATTEDWDTMVMTLGAGYTKAFGDFDLEAGLDFRYDMDDAALNAWEYGVAVTGAYSMIYGEVALTGTETDALDGLYAYVTVAPIDLLKIFADLEMDFADAAAEVFQGAEFGLEFETGATWWAVGYQINNDAFDGLNAPAALADGGLFFNWDINY
jgi:hypothetical protein